MRNRPTTFILLLTALLLLGNQCFADEVAVETISGKTLTGVLQSVDADGLLVGQGFDGINIAQVLSIATKRKSNSPMQNAVELKLVDGGQLFVLSPMIDGETATFQPGESQVDSISIQSIRAIVFRSSNLIQEAIAQPATDEDTVIVDRSDSLSRAAGVLESLDATHLHLNFGGKSRPIKREKVAAVVIADLGLNPPQGTFATLSLTDGSSIRGVLTSVDATSVTLTLTGKQTVRIARESLVRLDIDSDSIAFLSTLNPVEVRQQPQFSVQRQWRRNLSVEGNPIRLLGASPDSDKALQIQTFENGIGTSSFSRLVFENTKDFGRFLATVGIDAETDGRGDCEMRVEGDGITLWSQRIRGGEPSVEIDVDITGISQVALVVDPGEQFDLADHANWARARFLKTE
jgi:small nuclear ribonucleoprotein (snRNP)-like protein